MVYMAGDNNLDPNGVHGLERNEECRRHGRASTLLPNSIANRMLMRTTALPPSQRLHDLAADVVGTLGTTNTGNPKSLIDFIELGHH